jgi:hypothetical protein
LHIAFGGFQAGMQYWMGPGSQFLWLNELSTTGLPLASGLYRRQHDREALSDEEEDAGTVIHIDWGELSHAAIASSIDCLDGWHRVCLAPVNFWTAFRYWRFEVCLSIAGVLIGNQFGMRYRSAFADCGAELSSSDWEPRSCWSIWAFGPVKGSFSYLRPPYLHTLPNTHYNRGKPTRVGSANARKARQRLCGTSSHAGCSCGRAPHRTQHAGGGTACGAADHASFGGYNGTPSGLDDEGIPMGDHGRPLTEKHNDVIHAESTHPQLPWLVKELTTATVYVTLFPCHVAQ